MRILVTGGAGFIGSHVCERLLGVGHDVIAIDNFNEFYDPRIKRDNVNHVVETAARSGRMFLLCEGDIRDGEFVNAIFSQEEPQAVIHLAAAAGVRPSIENPILYEEVNIRGTMHLLEAARSAGIRAFLFASSSSVYGDNHKVPFAETDCVDNPISPYAATKKAGELLCHTYYHLYGMTIACLRFFTVYGPRQRPDLAIHKFARLISQGTPIPMFGDGSTRRDYTYIDDIISGVRSAMDYDLSQFEIFNLGESQTVELRRLVELLEEALGKKAIINHHPLQPGDVPLTFADVSKARELLGYRPTTSIEDGIQKFVEWFRQNSK